MRAGTQSRTHRLETGAWAASAEQPEAIGGRFNLVVEAVGGEQGGGRAESLLDGVTLDAWGVFVGQALGDLVEEQPSEFRAGTACGFIAIQCHDFVDKPPGQADVMVGEQFRTGLSEREGVLRAADAASYLYDAHIPVAHQNIEVTAHRCARQPEGMREVFDRHTVAMPEDVQDCFPAAFEPPCHCHHIEHMRGTASPSTFRAFHANNQTTICRAPRYDRSAMADRIYLDHASTTPPDPRVVDAMLTYLRERWYNPSSIYVEAQQARAAINDARAVVASAIGALPEEIIFTSGGSESDSLAIRGVLEASKARGRHFITCAVEHHAVLDTAEQLGRDGAAQVTIVGVGMDGRVDPAVVAAAVRDDTVLVSIMHANNEVGAINDIAEIAKRVHARNAHAMVHTDAVQSASHMGVNVHALGVDLLTLTGHKFYGPRGAGVLYARSGTPLAPQIIGGGQEKDRRAGTENTAALVGLAEAIRIAAAQREADIIHERTLQQRLIEELPKRIPLAGITGPRNLDHRLPGSASFVIAFVEGESILLALDLAGVAASSGSACTTGSVEPSHVLVAMGVPPALARGSLRFTFGRQNTEADVDRLLEVLPPIVQRMRALSPMPVTEPPADYLPWLAS